MLKCSTWAAPEDVSREVATDDLLQITSQPKDEGEGDVPLSVQSATGACKSRVDCQDQDTGQAT